jgi:hypothetical protein
MPGSQSVFDALLALEHPVHRVIQVILIGTGHAQHRTQGAGGGLGAQPARHRQLGARLDHRRGHHGAHQVPVPRRGGVDQGGHAQLGGGAHHRGHMPVRQAAGDVKRRGQITGGRQALERALQFVHLVLGPARQVGQRAGFHPAVVAVAFAQQHRRR